MENDTKKIKKIFKLYSPIIQGILWGLTVVCIVMCRLINPETPIEIARMAGILLFFFWPGWFLFRQLGWQHSVLPMAYIPLAFGLSIVLWHLIGLIVFLSQCSTIMAVLIALIVLYLPALTFLFFKSKHPTFDNKPKISKADIILGILVCFFILILLVMVWQFRLDINTSYDSGYFLTIVRKFAENENIELKSAHVYKGMVDRAYGLNSYLLGVGLLARLLDQDVFFIWGSLSIYGLLIFILSIYLLTTRIFNSNRIGLVVMAFVVIYQFPNHFVFPPCSYANPSMLTRPLLIVLLWIFTEIHQNPNWSNHFAFAALGASVISVHAFGVVVLFFYLSGALIMSALFEHGQKRKKIIIQTFLSGILLIIMVTPYLSLKFVHMFPSNSPLFTVKWDFIYPKVRENLIQIGNSYITKPSLMFYGYPWIGWLGIPFLSILYIRSLGIKRLHAGMLLGGIILIVSVSYNPWLFPKIAKILTVDITSRITYRAPIHAIGIFGSVGILVTYGLHKLKQPWIRNIMIVSLFAIAMIFVVHQARKHYNHYSVALKKSKKNKGNYDKVKTLYVQEDPFIRTIREKLPPGEAVFNTGRAEVERFLCPHVNIRCYDLYKANWISMNMKWDDHMTRRKIIKRFYRSSNIERLKILYDLQLEYVITIGKVALKSPFFNLVAKSNRWPKFSLYRTLSPEKLEEIISNINS